MKRKNTIINTHLLLEFIIVAVLLWGCSSTPHNKTGFLPTIPKETLRSGDIVFRQGSGLTSRIVQRQTKMGYIRMWELCYVIRTEIVWSSTQYPVSLISKGMSTG